VETDEQVYCILFLKLLQLQTKG